MAALSMPAELRPSAPPPSSGASFVRIVLAVWSSFFGVRKRREHDAIAQSVKPQHLIVAGLIGAALFVLTLLVVVRIVIATAAG